MPRELDKRSSTRAARDEGERAAIAGSPQEVLAGIASTSRRQASALADAEDDFAKAFIAARGKLDLDLDIGF